MWTLPGDDFNRVRSYFRSWLIYSFHGLIVLEPLNAIMIKKIPLIPLSISYFPFQRVTVEAALRNEMSDLQRGPPPSMPRNDPFFMHKQRVSCRCNGKASHVHSQDDINRQAMRSLRNSHQTASRRRCMHDVCDDSIIT